MPIEIDQKFKRVSKVVRLESLIADQRDLMAWWYCGVRKNQRSGDQPLAVVAFREVLSERRLSDDVVYKNVPLTALGQVRLGTVWHRGLCRYEMSLECEKFSIDFDQPGWRFTSFQEANRYQEPPPYPPEIHPLQYKNDKNWLLDFNLRTGARLVIPCLEFFTRAYGRSAELRRIIASYPWTECRERRLFAPLGESEEYGKKWKVKLRKRLVNGDVVLVAHAKYDPYTENVVRMIYGQMEANYVPGDRTPLFIKVAPWFRGPAELKVKGVWCDRGASFLGLQIMGCSEPGGVPIFRSRENANNAEIRLQEGDLGTAWKGTPDRKVVKLPEIVDLTDEVDPDPDSISAEIEDPEFELLGERRAVFDVRSQRAKTSSGQKAEGSDGIRFSSGDPHGSGQGVGYASIHAPPVMESQGVLRDVWNVLLFLKRKLPQLISSVEWFTFEAGYSQRAEPSLMGFHPFEEQDTVDRTTRKWPFIDAHTLSEARGLLVARLRVSGKWVHFVEIQRRPLRLKGKDGGKVDAEESFKGLVFQLDNQADVNDWIAFLLSDLRRVKGVVDKLAARCPGRAATFVHSKSRSDAVPCETAVMNALRKIECDLISSV